MSLTDLEMGNFRLNPFGFEFSEFSMKTDQSYSWDST